MPGIDIGETFREAKNIKQMYPEIPFVVLTPFSKEVSRRLANEDFSGVDYVFSWLGNVDLLLAIIKLMEDKMNSDNDILEVGIQTILLVEDSVRFYSSVLPYLYKFLLKQSLIFSTEALNEHEQMLRMRGRPKVILARTYEEAMTLYRKYQNKILGVVTDISFSRNGEKDKLAGVKLAKEIKAADPYVPIILESSESENQKHADELGLSFIDKNSKKFPVDLRNIISENFGFGAFVFRNPSTGEEVMRVNDLKEFQDNMFKIPQEITLGIRPEHIALAQPGKDAITGKVDVSEMMGSAIHLHVNAWGRDTIIIVQTMDLTDGEDLSIGSEISFAFGGNAVHVFNKETGENLEFWFAEDCVLDGEKNRIHFFL